MLKLIGGLLTIGVMCIIVALLLGLWPLALAIGITLLISVTVLPIILAFVLGTKMSRKERKSEQR